LRTLSALLAALVVGISLSACARPVGDFGRAESDPLHDGALNATRAWRDLKQPGSVFNLTDEEQEMRDRVWRYLVAPQAYDWFGDTLAELMRIGFVPVRFKPAPHDRYYLWLHGTSFASSKTRYSRLGDDIQADLDTMPTTFASICTVEGIDRQRGIAANGIKGLEDKMARGAAAQQAENRAVIGWFAAAVASRYASYSYALDHLLVETPHPGAIGVDAKLSQLEVYVEAAQSDQYCEPAAGLPAGGAQATIRSRYLRSAMPKAGS